MMTTPRMNTHANVATTEEDDCMSVSSLGEECTEEQDVAARDQLLKRYQEREAEDIGLRLHVALQIPYRICKPGMGEKQLPAQNRVKDCDGEAALPSPYLKVKALVTEIDTLRRQIVDCATTVLSAQNSLDRSTDMVCIHLDALFKQALANVINYRARIDALCAARVENREEYLQVIEKHRIEYERKVCEEKKRSDRDWQEIASKLGDLQDEKRGTSGITQLMEMMLNV